MCLEGIVCPHCNSGHVGIHSRVERRYQCHSCGKTFSETSGTPLWIVTLVLALLSHGCPLQAIVFAFGIDVRADELGGLTARALAAGEPSEARRSLSAGCAC